MRSGLKQRSIEACDGTQNPHLVMEVKLNCVSIIALQVQENIKKMYIN